MTPEQQLIQRLTEALELANGVLLKQRFAGLDQNPMGIHDVVGAAAGEGRRYLNLKAQEK